VATVKIPTPIVTLSQKPTTPFKLPLYAHILRSLIFQ